MTARSLVLGLDGADLGVIQELGAEHLPTLHRLLREGAYAALKSVQPPATLPNWTTFLTGADPGVHGVFDFTLRRGYRVRFAAGSVRECPTVLARLDKLGLCCACLGFPATWPPEELEHGVFISGWDAPVAFEADRSFVWPPSLYTELQQRFGPVRFDDVDEFAAEQPDWHDRLPDALVKRVGRKTELAAWLLGQRKWDVFACYFGESDTAAHHLWSLHDADSPRRPHRTTARQRQGLRRVYAALDEAVARLHALAGEATELTLVSDHGSGGSSDKVLYLNRVLAQAGLLRERDSVGAALARSMREVALTRLSPRLRDRIYHLAGSRLPGLLESRARFAAIDMTQTRVFSDELNYFPALHFNLRGREPRGIVEARDLASVRRDVTQVLTSLRDPWTGQAVVSWVKPREELFQGPHVTRAPDLLLGFALDQGYSYNLMPSAAAPRGTGAWRRLAPLEYLGRKGRSLAGSHRPHGVLMMHGPGVAFTGPVDAEMADATATVLARLGITPDAPCAGKVLPVLSEPVETGLSLPEAKVPEARARADEAEVEARLRALGYVE